MLYYYGIINAVHLLGIAIWIGGMFYVVVILNPKLKFLPEDIKFKFLYKLVKRFTSWVWLVSTIVISTGWMMKIIKITTKQHLGWHVSILLIFGHILYFLFVYIYFVPFRKFKISIKNNQIDNSKKCLKQIRVFMPINLTIGLTLILIAVLGQYYI